MLTRVPSDLPRLGALLISSAVLAFGISMMMVETSVGRPSSTSAIAWIIISVWTVTLGLVGFFVGALLRHVWPWRMRRAWLVVLTSYVIVVTAACLAGRSSVLRHERNAAPRVLVNGGFVAVRDLQPTETLRRGSRVIDMLRTPSDGSWSSNGWNLAVLDEDEIEVSGIGGGKALIDASALDYVTFVDVAELKDPAGATYLVLLLSGRPTGRRALFVVVTAGSKVAYAELLERTWDLHSVSLEIRRANVNGVEVVVVVSDQFTAAIAFRAAA